MLGNRKLIVDNLCEVRDLIHPWIDDQFYQFSNHTVVPGSIYLIGRQQAIENSSRIQQIVEQDLAQIIISNPHEGSSTLIGVLHQAKLHKLAVDKRIQVIGGGDMDPSYSCLQYDSFLPKILDYEENILAIQKYKELWVDHRPYKFLFLNGRGRPHRRQLLKRLNSILNQSIWTNLDSAAGPIQTLGPNYEFAFYKNNNITNPGYAKYELFNNTWGEIYLDPAPYLDTHFSLVTETVFEYPHSFRTEKIWKPIAIGHPFIAVASRGFYQDLHNLGFKTFGNLIDESFDLIDNNEARLEHIARVVEDLCQQDLAKFSRECYNICKYNQQLLTELRPKVRADFPDRFSQFINERPRV